MQDSYGPGTAYPVDPGIAGPGTVAAVAQGTSGFAADPGTSGFVADPGTLELAVDPGIVVDSGIAVDPGIAVVRAECVAAVRRRTEDA